MKKMLLLAICALLMACSEYDVEDATAKKFSFSVKGDFTNATFSRANSAMTADGVEMTDLWVVDYVKPSGESEGTVVQMLHQTKDDADWGEPSMALTLGTHHVLFLAARGHGASYEDGVVTWTKPLDTFYKDYEVTVVKTSNGNRSVTLDRVATKMVVNINDAIAKGTTSISFEPSVWYNGWDIINGQPVMAADDYTATVTIPSTFWGKTGSVSAWGLSDNEEWLTNVTVTSKAGENVNAAAVINSAPFKANRATVYSGKMYSSDSESSVMLNVDWLQSYEGVY